MNTRSVAPESRRAPALRLAVLGVLALATACLPTNELVDPENGQDAPGDKEVVSFGIDIQPIFDASCITCHQPGGEAEAHGINLDLTRDAAYDSLIGPTSQEDANFPLVQPGAPDLSWLYIKMSRDVPPHGLTMPPFHKLPDAQLQLVATWILSGAPND